MGAGPSLSRRGFLGGCAVGGFALVCSGGAAFAGRDYLARAGWWLTNDRPPSLRLEVPKGVVRERVVLKAQVDDTVAWSFIEATIDDYSIKPGLEMPVDTRQFEDGSHLVRLAIRDGSLRRNVRWVEAQFTSDNSPPQLTLDTRNPTTVQGRTALIQARSSEPVTIDLLLGSDQSIQLAKEGTAYVALLGVDPSFAPGSYPLKLIARDAAGNETTFSLNFEVSKADFLSESIDLPPEMLRLLTSGEYDEELKRINQYYATSGGARLWDSQFDMPVKGAISSGYGIARTYNGGKARNRHLGTDFDIPTGTTVAAVAKGKVAFAGPLEVRGNAVILDHGVGVHSTYYHMSRLDVKTDDVVARGQPLGLSGATGLATAPHLHLELRLAGTAVDPMEWLRKRFL